MNERNKLVPREKPLEGVVESPVECDCDPPRQLWPGETCNWCGVVVVQYGKSAPVPDWTRDSVGNRHRNYPFITIYTYDTVEELLEGVRKTRTWDIESITGGEK